MHREMHLYTHALFMGADYSSQEEYFRLTIKNSRFGLYKFMEQKFCYNCSTEQTKEKTFTDVYGRLPFSISPWKSRSLEINELSVFLQWKKICSKFPPEPRDSRVLLLVSSLRNTKSSKETICFVFLNLHAICCQTDEAFFDQARKKNKSADNICETPALLNLL